MDFYVPSHLFPDRVKELLAIGPIDVSIQYYQSMQGERWYWISEDTFCVKDKTTGERAYDSKRGFWAKPDRDYVCTELERKGYSPVLEELAPGCNFVSGYTLKGEIPAWFLELNEKSKEALQPVVRDLIGVEEKLCGDFKIYEYGQFGRHADTPGAPLSWEVESSRNLNIQPVHEDVIVSVEIDPWTKKTKKGEQIDRQAVMNVVSRLAYNLPSRFGLTPVGHVFTNR